MAAPQQLLDLPAGSTLLLAEISEPSNNDLKVIVVEATPNGPAVETEVGLATSVGPTTSSRAFEFTWWRYVAYGVRNESYFRAEAGEQLGERLFGTRLDTAFLNYVRATTFASDDFPGPLKHWYLYTGWHCIDVISDTAPDIRELSTDQVQQVIRSM